MPSYLIVLIVCFNLLAACKNSKSQVVTSANENTSDLDLEPTNTTFFKQTNIP